MEKKFNLFDINGVFYFKVFEDGKFSFLEYSSNLTAKDDHTFIQVFSPIVENKSKIIHNLQVLDDLRFNKIEKGRLIADEFCMVDADRNKVVFNLEYDYYGFSKDYLPKEFDFDTIYNWLLKAKIVFEKYEACQIPGIIPESKLESWSCVPNEYIKDEWWELQKQKEIKSEA